MQHDQEAKPFIQNAAIDILHPLTELRFSPAQVDCRDSPYIHQNVQSVLLSDSFYTKGMCDDKETAWKFYIPTKSWSPIPSPPGVDAQMPNDYTLAVYRSQPVWIGGRVDTGNKQECNRKIFVYEQGKGWKEDTKLIPSIPDDIILFYWNLFASGNDKYLIVAHESKLLVFDGKQWRQKDGPERDMRNILVHHGTLYFIIKKNQEDFFCKASMQSLLVANDYDWKMLKLPYAHEYSSLTLVGDHITMVASIGTISRTFRVLGFSSASDSWIGLTQLNPNYRSNILSVVGQPNGTLLLMVMMERTRVKDPSLPQNSSAVVLKQFSMLTRQPVLRLQFGMVEVAPNVLPYSPDGKLSVAAVVKLDLHAGFHVLSKLSAKLDSFKEKAGFSISQNKPLPMSDLYKESSVVKCIQSWVDDETPFVSPTWKNFFQILKELKLRDVADEIDRYLKSTAQKQQLEQKRDTTGLEDIAMLRSELESLYKKLFNNRQEEMKGLAAHMNSCIEKCRLGFDKVGKQIQTYEHSLKQLKEENDDLMKECQYLKNIEQGQPSAKYQRIDKSDGDSEVPDQGKISSRHLPGLIKKLKEHAAKWREIGTHLGFLQGELTNIQANPNLTPGAPTNWLGAMLEEWIQWAPEDNRGSTSFANLQDLKAALRDAGLGRTAHEFKFQ